MSDRINKPRAIGLEGRGKKNERCNLNTILERASQVSGVSGLAQRALDAKNKARPCTPEPTIIRERKPKKTKNGKNRKKVISANLRLIARIKSRISHIEGAKPKVIPADIWLNCQVIVSDQTGRAIAGFSNQISNKIALARIHRGALGIGTDSERKYSYRGDSPYAVRARRIFAVGYLLLSMSRPTGRKGPYTRLVTGIPQSAMIAAIKSPHEANRLHSHTLTGKHSIGATAGEIGYLDALKKSGFCYTRQAKWTDSGVGKPKGWTDYRPEEFGGKKGQWYFSLARYWVVTDRWNDVKAIEEKQVLWSDWTAGCQPTETWISPTVNGKTSGFCPSLISGKPPN